MRATCKAKGCRRKSNAKGFCPKHYLRWRRHGDPLVVKFNRDVPNPCSIDGCKKLAIAKNYCSDHYYRWNRFGDPLHKSNHSDSCRITTCSKPVFAERYCRFHYIRWRMRQGKCSVTGCKHARVFKKTGYCRIHQYYAKRYGNPKHPGTQRQKFCTSSGCTKPHYARGMCVWHYNDTVPPASPRLCSIPNCGKPHQARGFCHQHYLAWRRQPKTEE